MKRRLFLNTGLTVIGALMGAIIGAVVVGGLTKLTVNIFGQLNDGQRQWNLIQLKSDIDVQFKKGDSCSRSLGYYADNNPTAGSQSFAIKESGTGTILYSSDPTDPGGDKTVHNKIKIQAIHYIPGGPSAPPDTGRAAIHFTLSDEGTDRLQAAEPAIFTIHISSYVGSTSVIKECHVSGGDIARVISPLRNKSCAAGQFVSEFDAHGHPVCKTPRAAPPAFRLNLATPGTTCGPDRSGQNCSISGNPSWGRWIQNGVDSNGCPTFTCFDIGSP